MNRHSILRVVSKIFIPFIMLFALYVQFHGDFGPGGGFQAGVIFAAAFVLYALIYGVEKARKVLPATATRIMLIVGVLLFAGTGFVGIFLGGNYLDYSALASTVTGGQHLGIFIVELGVGITVAATMVTVFFVFSGQDF
ncbi:MAG: Na(+)/H(+) antiporter subunit B [Proteobacteria bacterium]|nr:Na(+)/H(+) antiporter subunit B [Pseudomonadota bacterium]